MSFKNLAKVLKQAGCVTRKSKVVAFQQQMRSLISDFVVQSLESISKSAKSTLTKTC